MSKRELTGQFLIIIKNGAPGGIRIRVEASRGLHDWPLHYRSLIPCIEISLINLLIDNFKKSIDFHNL